MIFFFNKKYFKISKKNKFYQSSIKCQINSILMRISYKQKITIEEGSKIVLLVIRNLKKIMEKISCSKKKKNKKKAIKIQMKLLCSGFLMKILRLCKTMINSIKTL